MMMMMMKRATTRIVMMKLVQGLLMCLLLALVVVGIGKNLLSNQADLLFPDFTHNSDASAITEESKTYRLFDLSFRTGKHDSPDAVVCIPKGYDCRRPPRIVLFVHGLTNTLDDVLNIWKIDRYIADGPTNTVLIMPEWALNPKAYNKIGRA